MDKTITDSHNLIARMTTFPEIKNGKIEIIQFLEASSDLVSLVGK